MTNERKGIKRRTLHGLHVCINSLKDKNNHLLLCESVSVTPWTTTHLQQFYGLLDNCVIVEIHLKRSTSDPLIKKRRMCVKILVKSVVFSWLVILSKSVWIRSRHTLNFLNMTVYIRVISTERRWPIPSAAWHDHCKYHWRYFRRRWDSTSLLCFRDPTNYNCMTYWYGQYEWCGCIF